MFAGKVALDLLPMLLSLFAHFVVLLVVELASRLAEFKGAENLVNPLCLCNQLGEGLEVSRVAFWPRV